MANKLLWALIAMLPVSVMAQKPVQSLQSSQYAQPTQPNYLDEMAKVDAQIAYVKKKTELREELKKSSTSIKEDLPRILSITVDERGASAQVVYDSGIIRWIKKGDVLDDGFRVDSIGKSSVVVAGHRGRSRLSFYTPQTNTAAEAPTVLMPGVPKLNIPLPVAPPPPSAQAGNSTSSTALPAAR